MQLLRSSASNVLVAFVFLASSLLAPGASGEPLREAPDAPAPECETDRSWASRHQALMPSSRQDCRHTLANVNHRLRVSHLRRGLLGQEFFEDRLGEAPQPHSVAPVGESESKLELAGSYGRWSYETDFDLGREARLDGGRFVPEDRSTLQFQSGLDFGLVRSRVELKGMQREEQRPHARGFAIDPGSTSELAARGFVDLALPHLPVLTLGVGRAEKEVLRGRRDVGERVDSDVASAALWYGGSGWQAYAVSSRYVFRDSLQPSAPEGVYEDHYVSGSWWLKSGWTLNPGLQYSEASYDDRVTWTRTLRATLGVYRQGLWRDGLLTLWGGYTRDRDTARTFDYQQFDLSVGLEHTFAEPAFLEGYELAIGSNAGVGHYEDRLYTGASGPSWRASLTLRVSAL